LKPLFFSSYPQKFQQEKKKHFPGEKKGLRRKTAQQPITPRSPISTFLPPLYGNNLSGATLL
jgi:hypothetical protein